MPEEFKNLLKAIEDLGYIPVEIPFPTDYDIDKCYITSLGKELLAYRRIRSIANANINNVRWEIAAQHLTEDVLTIHGLIKENKLKHPEELKEFVENCCAIYEQWDNVYRPAFVAIKDFRDSCKTPKSIDEMDVDELRKYIRTHNII